MEAWRFLKEDYECKGGIRTAALLRGILDHVPDGRRCTARDATLVTCSGSWGKDVAQYRIAAGADLQQVVQVP